MKKLFLFLLIYLISSTCYAKIVMLEWDASPTPSVTGYEVHISHNTPLPLIPIWKDDVGNELGHIITGLNENDDYYFAVVAYDDYGNKSVRSNIVKACPAIIPPTLRMTVTYFDTVIIK